MAKLVKLPNGKQQIILSDDEKAEAARTLRLASKGVNLWPAEYKETARDACKFIFDNVMTFEETKGIGMSIPRKRYLMNIARNWFKCRKTGRTFYIHKSRRLIVSWFVRALELYVAGFGSSGFGIAAKHFEGMNGACSFVWRVYYMYESLRTRKPEWELEEPTPRGKLAEKQLNTLILPNGAMFSALNSDKEGVRGGGLSYVVYEELSGYSSPNAVIGQGKIIVQGPGGEIGGMVCAISNASANDEYKSQIKGDHKITPVRNPDVTYSAFEGGLVQAIHYKADPLKDDDWVVKTKKGVPVREWDVEMELNDTIYSGDPVHAWFDFDIHCPVSGHSELWPMRDVSVHHIVGWDNSTSTVNFASVLIQVVETDEGEHQIQVLKEFVSGGASNIHAFCDFYDGQLTESYPKARRWSFMHECDPAANARSGSDKESRTNIQIMWSKNIEARVALSQNPNERRNAVDEPMATRLSSGAPQIVINAYGCPMLVAALQGGYAWMEVNNKSTGGVNVFKEPAKNSFSHVAEAFQYGMLRAMKIVKSTGNKAKDIRGGAKHKDETKRRKKYSTA